MLTTIVLFWFALWTVTSAPVIGQSQPSFRVYLFYAVLALCLVVLLVGPVRLNLALPAR